MSSTQPLNIPARRRGNNGAHGGGGGGSNSRARIRATLASVTAKTPQGEENAVGSFPPTEYKLHDLLRRQYQRHFPALARSGSSGGGGGGGGGGSGGVGHSPTRSHSSLAAINVSEERSPRATESDNSVRNASKKAAATAAAAAGGSGNDNSGAGNGDHSDHADDASLHKSRSSVVPRRGAQPPPESYEDESNPDVRDYLLDRNKYKLPRVSVEQMYHEIMHRVRDSRGKPVKVNVSSSPHGGGDRSAQADVDRAHAMIAHSEGSSVPLLASALPDIVIEGANSAAGQWRQGPPQASATTSATTAQGAARAERRAQRKLDRIASAKDGNKNNGDDPDVDDGDDDDDDDDESASGSENGSVKRGGGGGRVGGGAARRSAAVDNARGGSAGSMSGSFDYSELDAYRSHVAQASKRERSDDVVMRAAAAAAADGGGGGGGGGGSGGSGSGVGGSSASGWFASRPPLVVYHQVRAVNQMLNRHFFTIGERVQVEETSVSEFKSTSHAINPVQAILARAPPYINAYLNTHGGVIFFGIEDDGVVSGVLLDRVARDVLRRRIDDIVSLMRPAVDPYLWSTHLVPVLNKDVSDENVSDNDDAAVHAEEEAANGGGSGDSHTNLGVADDAVESGGSDARAPPAGRPRGSSDTTVLPTLKEEPVQADGGNGNASKASAHSTTLPLASSSMRRSRSASSTPRGGNTTTNDDAENDDDGDSQQHPARMRRASTSTSVAAAITHGARSDTARDFSESRFVVCIRVHKGRAPVYFLNARGPAWYRSSGSTRRMSADMVVERVQSGRPLRTLASVPREFIGRGDELRRIRDFLSDATTSVVLLLLEGLPLVGKSTLARRLMVEFSSSYSDAAFIVNLRGVSQPYLSVSDAMSSVVRRCFPTLNTLPEREAQLRGLYEACFDGKRAILLIENCSSERILRALQPPPTCACLVIVTSRKSIDTEAAFTVSDTLAIHLTELNPSSALQLLDKFSRRDNQAQSVPLDIAKDIVRHCGYMPLPIRMAGAMLRSGQSPELLMQRLRDPRFRVQLVKDAGVPALLSNFSSTTVRRLLPLSLFPGSFDSGQVSVLLHSSYTDTEDILGELVSYSLIEFSYAGNYFINDLFRDYLQSVIAQHRNFCEYLGDFVNWARVELNTSGFHEPWLFWSRHRANIEAAASYANYLRELANAHVSREANASKDNDDQLFSQSGSQRSQSARSSAGFATSPPSASSSVNTTTLPEASTSLTSSVSSATAVHASGSGKLSAAAAALAQDFAHWKNTEQTNEGTIGVLSASTVAALRSTKPSLPRSPIEVLDEIDAFFQSLLRFMKLLTGQDEVEAFKTLLRVAPDQMPPESHQDKNTMNNDNNKSDISK